MALAYKQSARCHISSKKKRDDNIIIVIMTIVRKQSANHITLKNRQILDDSCLDQFESKHLCLFSVGNMKSCAST